MSGEITASLFPPVVVDSATGLCDGCIANTVPVWSSVYTMGDSMKSVASWLVLSPGFASKAVVVMSTVIDPPPPLFGTTTMVTPAVPARATAPNAQVTTAATSTHEAPWVGTADTNVEPDGRDAVNPTSVATPGPAFETVNAYVRSSPAKAGSNDSVPATAMSATGSVGDTTRTTTVWRQPSSHRA